MQVRISFIFLMFLGLGGCATVHQVDREHLARRTMQFDPEPHQQAFLSEVHSIREAASGGSGKGAGGGCGCN